MHDIIYQSYHYSSHIYILYLFLAFFKERTRLVLTAGPAGV